MAKQVIFSGVQPSGILTLGNYIGAVRNWTTLQEEYESYFCVVDMHAITVRQDPQKLKENAEILYALFLAAGLDPKKSRIFVQSHVPQHAQLSWVLNCFAYMGELSRMTQFKEKSDVHSENINAGLFDYPVLMAADILLYGTHLVPVGDDQKQHIELTRDVAERFNGVFGDTFIIPEPHIPKMGARIMSLQDPEKKMSKSDENENGYISMMDTPDVIVNKVKRAVTDSDNRIIVHKEKQGVSNLLEIFATLEDLSIQQAEQHFEGKGYGALKSEVADAIIAKLEPIQKLQQEYLADKAQLHVWMREGASFAQEKATPMLNQVYEKVGFVV